MLALTSVSGEKAPLQDVALEFSTELVHVPALVECETSLYQEVPVCGDPILKMMFSSSQQFFPSASQKLIAWAFDFRWFLRR
mmetsp:Transcript_8677/g.17182  ORF Transcript_8677/g.17182 Transcript_8677/m.17182 type:complete len:82 (-) Transcript_8677:337-582(-)